MKYRELYEKYMITSMVAGFEPVEVESASGCTMRAHDGKEYLDCFSGIAVVNAGHNHEKINAAARAQMDKLVHCGTCVYYNPRAAELAEQLAQITPGKLQKSFFGNSGAEAIEGALRLAKHYTGKWEFLALTQSFHGRTNMTLSITGNSGRKLCGGPYYSGVAFTPAPYCYRCPFKCSGPDKCNYECAEFAASVIKFQTSGHVAAMIAEPVMGEGGIIVPPEKYFSLVKEILDAHDILFICDEVQAGFGRTGKMFAIEHYGVEPQIMTMAKGIANGFPLAAFIAEPEIADAFTPGSHLSTFGGNPVSCAAALANIEAMNAENIPENAAARGEQLKNAFDNLKMRCPLIGDVRGKGLMFGIELVKDAAKTPAAAEAGEARKRCREAGILVGVGGPYANVVRIQPPLTISEAEIARVADILGGIFMDLT